MASSGEAEALRAMFQALRRPGGEVQLTQVLAAFAGSDGAFAAGLARALVPSAAEALGPLPEVLTCEAEYVLPGGKRVDLVFSDETSVGLLVEIKIDASYGLEQLPAYVTAAEQLGLERTAVGAVTKSPAWVGEEEVAGNPRWLGSVRWSDVYARLHALEHAHLTREWRAFLELVCEQQDFGVVSLNQEAIRAWPRYSEGEAQLRALMETIAHSALEVVREECARPDERPATADEAQLLHKNASPVWVWKDRVHLQFAVPASAEPEERLRVQFYAYGGLVYFCVEARYPDARHLLKGPQADLDLVAITKQLSEAEPEFRSGNYWGNFWSRWHPMEPLIEEGGDPADQLLIWIREDVRALVDSGLFDALEAAASREARTAVQSQEPDPD